MWMQFNEDNLLDACKGLSKEGMLYILLMLHGCKLESNRLQ